MIKIPTLQIWAFCEYLQFYNLGNCHLGFLGCDGGGEDVGRGRKKKEKRVY